MPNIWRKQYALPAEHGSWIWWLGPLFIGLGGGGAGRVLGRRGDERAGPVDLVVANLASDGCLDRVRLLASRPAQAGSDAPPPRSMAPGRPDVDISRVQPGRFPGIGDPGLGAVAGAGGLHPAVGRRARRRDTPPGPGPG